MSLLILLNADGVWEWDTVVVVVVYSGFRIAVAGLVGELAFFTLRLFAHWSLIASRRVRCLTITNIYRFCTLREFNREVGSI